MEKVIKKINETMGDFEGSMLTFQIIKGGRTSSL